MRRQDAGQNRVAVGVVGEHDGDRVVHCLPRTQPFNIARSRPPHGLTQRAVAEELRRAGQRTARGDVRRFEVHQASEPNPLGCA